MRMYRNDFDGSKGCTSSVTILLIHFTTPLPPHAKPYHHPKSTHAEQVAWGQDSTRINSVLCAINNNKVY